MAGIGCQNSRPPQEAAARQVELNEERQEAVREAAETRREAAEKKAEVDAQAQKEIADERQDVAEAQKELAAAQARTDGGAGAGPSAGAATVSGRVKSLQGAQLIVQDTAGTQYTVSTDASTRVVRNGAAAKLQDIGQGAEVRVSYDARSGDKLAREVTVMTPAAGR